MKIHQHIKDMPTYNPPIEGRHESHWMRLDFNERTSSVPKIVTSALVDYANCNLSHLYPAYGDFPEQLALHIGSEPSELMITNGSDQAIDIILRAVLSSDSEAIVPIPTFAMHTHSSKLSGALVHTPQYTREIGYPLNEVLSLINTRTAAIVICNPNNPTGTLVTPEDIIRIAKAAPHAAILVDECYHEYSKTSVMSYINSHPNIAITRTFSKTWGLASLRLGYILSAKQNIEHFLKLRGPYDVNIPAIVAAKAALSAPSYVNEYIDEVMNHSKPALELYLTKKGITYWPSAANFILLHLNNANELEQKLRKKNILVRPRNDIGIENTIRISIGTYKETLALIAAMEE